MSDQKFELVKHFDSHNMPEDVFEEFFKRREGKDYTPWYVDQLSIDDGDIVAEWLSENGADMDESVIIEMVK